jgi:demethylmenaquinone methyltransferase / 2-methoxy-6-polyprenyl-1,4-benzoquinol methylase
MAETKTRTIGARPEGISDQDAASNAVREMFTSIAPRYDVLNHVLSMNVDRLWWWRTARKFRHILRRKDARVLDLCCGTGDMAFALQKQFGDAGASVSGADFSHAMLRRATVKGAGKPMTWLEADALELPFTNERFDLVTSAFGFRNLANYDAGLREIYRVLRSNGEAGILDFGEPKGLLGHLYRFYFKRVLPKIGTAISGVRGSVEKFPEPQEMLARMKRAGFRETKYTPYTFGIAGVYWGKK